MDSTILSGHVASTSGISYQVSILHKLCSIGRPNTHKSRLPLVLFHIHLFTNSIVVFNSTLTMSKAYIPEARKPPTAHDKITFVVVGSKLHDGRHSYEE